MNVPAVTLYSTHSVSVKAFSSLKKVVENACLQSKENRNSRMISPKGSEGRKWQKTNQADWKQTNFPIDSSALTNGCPEHHV